MTKAQANWASKHDWFISMHPLNAESWSVTVLDGYWQNDEWVWTEAKFTDYSELRDFAGY